MSKDIRSFFSVVGKKTGTASITPAASKKNADNPKRKSKAIALSSDDDEIVAATPPPTRKEDKSKIPKNQAKKRRVIESDEEDSAETAKKTNGKPNLNKLKAKDEPKLTPISPSKYLEQAMGKVAKESKAKQDAEVEKKTVKAVVIESSDDEFEKEILAALEKSVSEPYKKSKTNGVPKSPAKPSSKSKTPEPTKKSPHKSSSSDNKASSSEKKEKASSHPKEESTVKKKATPEKIIEEKKRKEDKKEKVKDDHHSDSDDKHASTSKSSAKKTKPKTRKTSEHEQSENLEDSVMADEQRQDKKRMSMILYQKFKNRGGPANPGSKEIPKGKPNCLAGLQFLVTGILDSLERDEAADLIKELGGKVVQSVSKKLNFMVVGDDAGPAKLAKADELGIKMISEDDLLNLIRKKSDLPEKKNPKKEPKPEKREDKTSPKKSSEKEKKPLEKRKHKETATTEKPKREKLEKTTPTKEPKKDPTNTVNGDLPEFVHQVTEHEKNIASEENMAWVDRYKPTSVKQIIGQQGPASNCQKLMNWLSKWSSNHDGKKKLSKPNPWAKNDDGAFYKAALLSGPPGVGKTTTALLVCKELGFDTVEFNASDTRSKKLLKAEVSELLSNKSLHGYFHSDSGAVSKKHVLIMDEVDGMAGNEDRGGIQELIGLIKNSSVPIICMCNDRNHAKMRSLVNYCYDLRFSKPRLEQIKGAMMSICFKQGLKMEPGALEEIITGTGNDVRQTLNHLAMYAADKSVKLTTSKAKEEANTAKKDVKIGPWEVIRKVFSAEEHKKMSIHDKSDLFFYDYSIAPLFVQQNYLRVKPQAPKNEIPDLVAKTADSLSLGDMVERRIRSQMAWSLLPVQAIFSSVLPGEYMAGSFTSQIDFPGWLGKNSKLNKRNRLAQEIHDHTRVRTSGSRLSIRLDYAPFLLAAIINPLKNKGLDGVAESLNVIKEYRLLREDIDSLIELCSWPKKKNPMDGVESKVKAALTRAYNKEVQPYSYSVVTVGAKKKRTAEVAEDEDSYGLEGEDDEAVVNSDNEKEEEDKLENNPFIKVKKKPVKAESAAGSSKAKAAGSGKGRGKK